MLSKRIGSSTTSKNQNDFWFKNHTVKIVILQWVDICGVLRTRLVPASTFKKITESNEYLNCAPLDTCVTTTAEFIPKIMPFFVDSGKIWPDVSSLKLANHSTRGYHAAVCFGHVEFQNTDARHILKGLVEKTKVNRGLEFLVGMELEFCLLVPGTLDPAEKGSTGVAHSSKILRSKAWPLLTDIIAALDEAGIRVEQAVKEYGASAYEVALSPLPPVEAVDAYIYTMEVIKNIAHKAHLTATFYPTPYAGETGQKSGQHIHISATPAIKDKSWNPDTAMSGLLSHIPALTAIGMAQIDSYERVGVGKMCTGGFVGWGDNNRDMPVRRADKNHWEVRINDATSNSYAMVAGIIGALLDSKPLTIERATKFTLFYSEEERQKMGLTKSLPSSLEEALKELESDMDWAICVLGREYVEWFIALKKAEAEALSKMEAKERRLLLLDTF
ncbi:hypothetical protein FVEN_g806 [Fusarium venenatum]|uniref:Glutamine synthetase n=1 Tax=Fusarium venenatum TaxID=56646 RepID=A0A2L2TKU0_9HYPO|nr:uncharacterized protein FVRRES_10786 [Fusarium venenatum]KAG8361365.1 hypothetical protein FVEN_g806 [Fusarium venenatum]KAH6967364.1 hypothetical protein EDB82DRAFT_518398 [Fusarium venenatum]CEI70709.1 unnamed protein product [Fusarium venenatum]